MCENVPVLILLATTVNPKWCGYGHVNQFKFYASKISLEWLKLETSNFAHPEAIVK